MKNSIYSQLTMVNIMTNDYTVYRRIGKLVMKQAIKDYKFNCKMLSTSKFDNEARRNINDIEFFLKSEWCKTITLQDGNIALMKLREWRQKRGY